MRESTLRRRVLEMSKDSWVLVLQITSRNSWTVSSRTFESMMVNKKLHVREEDTIILRVTRRPLYLCILCQTKGRRERRSVPTHWYKISYLTCISKYTDKDIWKTLSILYVR